MTKAQLIELLRNHLAGGSVTADYLHKVDPRILEKYISQAFSQLLYEIYRKDRSSLSLYVKTYTDITVAQDAKTNIYYSTLPASVIQLPDAASGVRRVSPEIGSSLSLVAVDAETIEYFDGLEISDANINPVIGYFLRNNQKVEYYNMTASLAADEYRMDLVISFEEYADSDDIYIPSGRGIDLLTILIQLLENRKPVDLLNDNAELQNK